MVNKDELPNIKPDEFLYRGIVELNWNYEKNEPSSATFKDSKGVSVDRDYHRTCQLLQFQQVLLEKHQPSPSATRIAPEPKNIVHFKH